MVTLKSQRREVVPVNKSDVVRALVLSGHALDPAAAEATLDRVLDVISKSLACGEAVSIRNFGKFEPRLRTAVTRKHPVTRREIAVPPTVGVGFVPSAHLKERINSNA